MEYASELSIGTYITVCAVAVVISAIIWWLIERYDKKHGRT